MEKSKKLARANWKGSGDKSVEEKWYKMCIPVQSMHCFDVAPNKKLMRTDALRFLPVQAR